MATFLRKTQVEPLAISARMEATALSVYRPLTGARIGGGISFNPLGCIDDITGVIYDELCGPITPFEPNVVVPSTCVEFEPFSMHLELEQDNLTGMSAAEVDAYLDQHMRLWQSAVIAREVRDAAYSDNPYFTNEADTVTGLDATSVGALAAVEDALAVKIGNGAGMLHMTPGMLTILASKGAVSDSGGTWRSPTGHQVVADAGWVGSGGTGYIYGSGPVYVAVANEYDAQTLQLADNRFSTFRKLDALVAFEPCAVVRAAVTSP